MDSLSQIVLGAAVGEAVLGKKIGNRAMIWGAIAGTIPDLDVIANYFMSPIDALAFHRGISHSLLINFILAFILGYAVFRLYQFSWHRCLGLAVWSLLGITSAGLLFFRNSISLPGVLGFIMVIGVWNFLIYKRYFRVGYETPIVNLRSWIWLFMLALITHPILDCFTTYGTQILLPFSDKRVAFNNISVVDPIYTLPFLFCLLTAASLNRTNPSRRFWNNAGIVISTFYIVFTIFNKSRVNTIFENTLVIEEIQYDRYLTTPTILNNMLWFGIAESKDNYTYGFYSFFDEEKKFKLHTRPKSYKSLEGYIDNDKTISRLRWFSDGFFDMVVLNDTLYEYSDLRFGNLPVDSTQTDNAVFKFKLYRHDDGQFELLKNRQKPDNMDVGAAFKQLWDRILGRAEN